MQIISKGILFSSLIGMSFLAGDYNTKKDASISNISKEIYVPEYKRGLEKVFMKFQPEIEYQDNLIKEVLNYSDINFMVAKSAKKEFESFLKTIPKNSNKILPFYYESEGILRQSWAQDLFEFLVTDKNKKIVFPEEISFINSPSSLFEILEKDSIPYTLSKNNFEGGNISYDYFKRKNILFVGDRSPNSRNLTKYEKMINYKKYFGADTIVFFNNNPNETPLFHLDQCFTLIDSGKVAVINLDNYSMEDFYNEKGKDLSVLEENFYFNYSSVGANSILVSDVLTNSLNYSKKMLRGIRDKFNQLGYEVFSLPASFWQIVNYQSYMNSRLFIDGGKRKILMPIFPNEEGIYDINYFRNKKAKTFFESFGLEVIPVENKSWTKQGNIHCLINEI